MLAGGVLHVGSTRCHSATAAGNLNSWTCSRPNSERKQSERPQERSASNCAPPPLKSVVPRLDGVGLSAQRSNVGLSTRHRLGDKLLQHHLLRLRVVVQAVEHLLRVLAELLIGHRLPIRVELSPEELAVLGPHLIGVHVLAMVENRNLLIEVDKLGLLQKAVSIEVVDPEEFLHKFFKPLGHGLLTPWLAFAYRFCDPPPPPGPGRH
mmetsp:Transcript_27861/g.62995  ORF Transcript_27861/g.62995 Transcript_27861/m.62995 type:complete len:208 (+) Transcript_27861:43-666(+)